jgi:predicted homoserine dehydrogenase-like protein
MMMILDTALKKRAAEGNPIRVGMVGVGFIGRACATQLVNQVPGMTLVAIANRTARRRSTPGRSPGGTGRSIRRHAGRARRRDPRRQAGGDRRRDASVPVGTRST